MLRNIGDGGVAKNAPSVHALHSGQRYEERLGERHDFAVWMDTLCERKDF
jgi:hypothetical protein